MTTPGMFLSQPGMEMLASWCWAQVTISMESAMISRTGESISFLKDVSKKGYELSHSTVSAYLDHPW